MGDSLSSLTVKELKQLENRLERGLTRIRSKKVKIDENECKSYEFHNKVRARTGSISMTY